MQNGFSRGRKEKCKTKAFLHPKRDMSSTCSYHEPVMVTRLSVVTITILQRGRGSSPTIHDLWLGWPCNMRLVFLHLSARVPLAQYSSSFISVGLGARTMPPSFRHDKAPGQRACRTRNTTHPLRPRRYSRPLLAGGPHPAGALRGE